jgi:hypothetical protein
MNSLLDVVLRIFFEFLGNTSKGVWVAILVLLLILSAMIASVVLKFPNAKFEFGRRHTHPALPRHRSHRRHRHGRERQSRHHSFGV